MRTTTPTATATYGYGYGLRAYYGTTRREREGTPDPEGRQPSQKEKREARQGHARKKKGIDNALKLNGIAARGLTLVLAPA